MEKNKDENNRQMETSSNKVADRGVGQDGGFLYPEVPQGPIIVYNIQLSNLSEILTDERKSII